MSSKITESHVQTMLSEDDCDNEVSIKIKTELDHDDSAPINIAVNSEQGAWITETQAKHLISGLRRSLRLRKYGIR